MTDNVTRGDYTQIQIQPMLRLNSFLAMLINSVAVIQIQPMLRLNLVQPYQLFFQPQFKYNQC